MKEKNNTPCSIWHCNQITSIISVEEFHGQTIVFHRIERKQKPEGSTRIYIVFAIIVVSFIALLFFIQGDV